MPEKARTLVRRQRLEAEKRKAEKRLKSYVVTFFDSPKIWFGLFYRKLLLVYTTKAAEKFQQFY